MKNTNLGKARIQFGEQLEKYIKASELSQEEFAVYMETGPAYIRSVIKGGVSVGIDIIEKYAVFFGVQCFEMLNPKFPIPSVRRMSPELNQYLKEVILNRKNKKAEPSQKLAPFVDEVLATDFLRTAKTAREFAEHIKDKVVTTAGKISTLLTYTKRNEIVRTISATEWGGKVNKYILREAEEKKESKKHKK